MYKNISITILSILVLTLAYFTYQNKLVLRAEKSFNDSLLVKVNSVYLEKENSIRIDSLRYELVVDSLNDKIAKLETKRKHELNKFKPKVAKIYSIVTDSSFFAINDSIEKLCTMRYE
jgi:hypothetical protein